MKYLDIISKYYADNPKAKAILISHCEDVAGKALNIAFRHPEMHLNNRFIEQAAMIHDIGMIFCKAPEICCDGKADYICHGYLGAEIITKEGYPIHALVCERHTGAGITLQEIKRDNLPLPQRDFLPISLEEQLICYADKFFSKTRLGKEKSIDKVRKKIAKHGADSLRRFEEMHNIFGS
jgi:uncharacterized protein